MANLMTDPDDDLPPNSGSPQRSDVNRAHHQQMADHLITNSLRAGHGGHMAGKAGPGNTGHTMPLSDAHLQKGSYIRQGIGARMPQNTSSDGAGSASGNGPDADDYAKVDK